MLQLVFLGTGTSQGVPVIACPCAVCASGDARDKRLRSSVLVRCGERQIVIDAGPDFRQQMLRGNVRRLDAILFTHAHKDHTGGLDDVRAFNYVQGRPMDVYAETRVQEALKLEYAYVFARDRYPGIPEIRLHTIDEAPFVIDGDLPVTPVRTMHLHLPILGFRIGKMAYLTDTNSIADSEKKKLTGLECLVVNGLRKESHISHFSLPEAIALIDELKPAKAFITHVSHQMGLHQPTQAALPPNVFLAYDGLEVTVAD
jgi:phosphoribosyl 1,2-cyclic phosphate phosphodiesterase